MRRLLNIPFAPVFVGLFLVGATVFSGALEPVFDALSALGPPPIPADNPQSVDEDGYPLSDDPKVELGKILYFENRLSGDASVSCADCHSDQFGWSDGQDLCLAYQGTGNWRNCPTVMNAAYLDRLFWDSRSDRLENQALDAATSAVEGHGNQEMMEERLRQIPDYVARFTEVFGTEWPEKEDIWRAIAAFERTIIQPDTPFDNYMRGDELALSPDAIAGMELFTGKAACIQCHTGPLLTDQKFHNIGVPDNPLFASDPLVQITFRFQQYMRGVPEEIYRKAKTDLGVYLETLNPEDMGKFRTAPLRYLIYTPPYMHNGAFFTLEEVVDFYNQGGGSDQVEHLAGMRTRTSLLRPLGLTENEKRQLIAFLESTSGEEVKVERPVLPEYAVLETHD